MMLKCLKLACVFQKMYTLYTFSSSVFSSFPRDYHLKNISVLWRKENSNTFDHKDTFVAIGNID